MSEKRESFAELFAKERMPSGRARVWNVGDEAQGLVAHVSRDAVFVDLDAKQQGYFDRMDLREDIEVGDPVAGLVVAVEGDQIKLATRFGRDSGRGEVELALAEGIPIEGKVTGVNKGGAEVEVAGMRGFCPFSQLDNRYVEDPTTFVSRVLEFLVVEIKDRDVVLSRRKLLERQARVARESVLARLQEGATLRGQVTQIRDFGAFVDIGGIEGLIPMRELSHDREQRAEDVLAVGDVVETRVVKVELGDDKVKITLSLKALAADPWDGIDTIAPIGKVLAGQVTRLTEFGAFLRLSGGIEGLLHISEIGVRVKHPSEVLSVGDQRLVVVKSLDYQRKRIALTLADETASAGDSDSQIVPVLGALVNATVEKHERFGVFVQVDGARGSAGRGLVPNAELGLQRGVDIRKELPLGTKIRAKVMDPTQGRLRLSIRAASDDAERAVFDSFRQDQSKGGSMGTLGDLLREKLKK